MLTLYGHPDSGHAYKVRLCLTIGSIEHNYQVIDIWSARDQRPQEFQQQAKFQEVPLLIDNDKPYVQSNAILIHLADQYSIFGGEDTDNRQNCLQWLLWEANKIGMCLPQLRYAKRFAPQEFNQGALDWLEQRFYSDINTIEQELSDGRHFILGDSISIADFSLCGYLFFADEAKMEIPQHVQQWLQRISTLEGWQHPYDLMAGQS